MASTREKVAEAIRAARQKQGLTQQALAERVGINLRSLSRIESAEAAATLDTFMKLAVALDLDPSTVLSVKRQRPEVTRERLRLEAEAGLLIVSLTDTRLADLIKIAEALGAE